MTRYNVNGKLIARADYARKKWCSRRCYAEGSFGLSYDMTPEQRLRELAPAKGAEECWPISESHQDGPMCYGRFKFKNKAYKAHRLAFEMAFGPIADFHEIRHVCNFPPCTNPNHLISGTRQDNMDDKRRGGRAGQPRGTDSALAKLTKSQVFEMRSLYSKGGITLYQIAKQFDVSGPTACRAVKGYGAYANVR